MDSSFRPLYINAEAVRILTYPDSPRRKRSVERVVAQKVRSVFVDQQYGSTSPEVRSLKCGMKRYVCRLFSISPLPRKKLPSMTVLVIDRHLPSLDLLKMVNDFRLTKREWEAVQLLVQGLTSKEIASRMGISPNTVKVFLRLAMVKTGVSTRSGIVGKLLQTSLEESVDSE